MKTKKHRSEYAKAGVDYRLIEPFKAAMIETAQRTVRFPNKRDVFIDTDVLHAHGGCFEYCGVFPHGWCTTQEGLGNENWIAELLYMRNSEGPTYHDCIAFDNAMMAVNDNLAQGALPVTYTDEVAASNSEWFQDKKRATEFAEGLYDACWAAGMALVAGESPVYKYLINPRPPVKSACTFGGTVNGIIAPKTRKITGKLLRPGDRIIGIASSGIHANGISLVIRRVMGDADLKGLPDEFETKLPSGTTIGEAVHIRTLCYVRLMEELLDQEVEIHAVLPGTGDGVGKLGFDKRQYRCHIHSWLEVPELFLYMLELGVSFEDCLKTFNMGVGYYIFVPKQEVNKVLAVAEKTGFPAKEIGIVKTGKRGTVFAPNGYKRVVLPPPGE